MNYIDIHTHQETDEEDVKNIINIDIRESFIPKGNAMYSVGIHPWYANRNLLTAFRRIATYPQVVLIGECGLDKLSETAMGFQKELFTAQIEVSEEIRKPLIIHCVKAWGELLEIKKALHPSMPWIIHGFRGKRGLAEQLLSAGFFLSFGLLHNTESLKAAWEAKHLLTETDGKRTNIRMVHAKIAEGLNVPKGDLTREVERLSTALILPWH